jgi:hypothetical protein
VELGDSHDGSQKGETPLNLAKDQIDRQESGRHQAAVAVLEELMGAPAPAPTTTEEKLEQALARIATLEAKTANEPKPLLEDCTIA